MINLKKIVSSALLIGLSLPTAAAQILKYSDHEPLGGMRTHFINDVFFPAIERESHGRLKVEAHWNGELSSSYKALDTVSQGKTVDMSTVVPEYTADKFPLHQLLKSFPVGPTGDDQVKLFQKLYTDVPELNVEMTNNHIVNIFSATGYPVAFYSTKPIHNLADIKESKWRTASFWHRAFLTNTGAIPVIMPWNDKIFQALQDKSLDGLMVNVDSGYTLNVHKVAPYVLVSKSLWLGHLYPLVMNQDTWNSLPQEDKDAIHRAAESSYRQLGVVMDHSFSEQIKALQDGGATVNIIKPEDLNNWVQKTRYKEIQADWVSEQEDKGVKGASSVLNKLTKLLEG